MSVWKSDETLLSICILNFSFKNDFVWEEISNIRHSVSSPDETPRSSSKILRCASYLQLSSRCFIWWWNTASHVWYITITIIRTFPKNKKKNMLRIIRETLRLEVSLTKSTFLDLLTSVNRFLYWTFSPGDSCSQAFIKTSIDSSSFSGKNERKHCSKSALDNDPWKNK